MPDSAATPRQRRTYTVVFSSWPDLDLCYPYIENSQHSPHDLDASVDIFETRNARTCPAYIITFEAQNGGFSDLLSHSQFLGALGI